MEFNCLFNNITFSKIIMISNHFPWNMSGIVVSAYNLYLFNFLSGSVK